MEDKLVVELSEILGSGRFTTLLEQLRVRLPSRQASRPNGGASRQMAVKSLTYDDLISEIRERITQLEKFCRRFHR